MFDYLKGKITFCSPTTITLEVNNIGYSIKVPLNDLAKLPSIGSEALLFTSFIVREDSQTLYGFLERTTKELFETLITLSGIGPKSALSIIGHVDHNQLYLAVSKGDVKLLSKIPGVGKKTAERLLIELKDKFKNLNLENFASTNATLKGPIYDAVLALISLGYNSKDAHLAVKKAMEKNQEEKDLSLIISSALRQL